jgi:hypothetical protein
MIAIIDSIDRSLADLLDQRIALSQRQDALLTTAELIAKLNVPPDYGR